MSETVHVPIEAANWKSKMVSPQDVDTWMQRFALEREKIRGEVIICPPFVFAERVIRWMDELKLPVALGVQDVSQFSSNDKAVTGEITAEMLKAIGVKWVVIGHSERRTKLGETEEVLATKVARAKACGLKVIFCIPDAKTPVPQDVDIVAYEPPTAIGTGNAASPEEANATIMQVKEATKVPIVLYGGSVTSGNVHEFTKQPGINGNLVGGASLTSGEFGMLVVNSTSG